VIFAEQAWLYLRLSASFCADLRQELVLFSVFNIKDAP